MVYPSVERATSDMLIGPDWAMNLEICDILNRDPGQAKDVVKGLKKRIGNKNPKIQLLALTLLETVIKNCGDIVHMHVAEREILHEMVKIVKKKTDHHVKQKILTLIDTWQEVFGGPRARYRQYYQAYQELLRSGAVFPQRPERSAPILTPPQTPPLSSNPQSLRNTDYRKEAAESSTGSDLPNLSLSEIQNARGIMDVLVEMLTALDPGNKEGLRQDVIVDLVEQCRAYKMRVVQLVYTTLDEELLSHGLALNDDLQRILIKHDTITSETSFRTEKTKSLQALVDVDDAVVKTQDTNTDKNESFTSGTGNQALLQQLLLPAPPATNGPATPSAMMESHIDLLSGGDFLTPHADNSLALVPVSQPTASPPSNQQNILALADMFSQNDNAPASLDSQSANSATQSYPSTPQFQQQQQQQLQPQEPGIYSNGSALNSPQSQYELTPYMQSAHLNHESDSSWNAQGAQSSDPQQQALVYGANSPSSSALPPPPWEAQTMLSSYMGSEHLQTMQNMPLPQPMQSGHLVGMQPPPMQNGQLVVMHSQPMQSGGLYPLQMQNGPSGGMYTQQMPSSPLCVMYPQQILSGPPDGMYPQRMQSGQLVAMYPQPMQNGQLAVIHPQLMQSGQQVGMYPQPMQGGPQMAIYPHPMQSAQLAGYSYDQVPGSPFLDHRMRGLSMQDDSRYLNHSHQTPSSGYLQPKKPAKPEDKLFGDLVNIAKSKPNKPDGSNVGSL